MKSTVLIVDDIADNVNVAANILIDNYINVGVAQNGKDALVYAKNNMPDLILLDIMMPEMNGFEVCEELKKDIQTREIPIIFLSAKSDKENITKAFKLGGVDYISKPFNEDEFIARVQTHLDFRSSKLNMAKELKNKIKAQEELQKNEEKLRAIINSIPDLIFYKDTKSNYTGCNKAFADFIGHTTEEVIGKNDLFFYNEKEAKIFIESDNKVLKTGHDAFYQEWVKNNNHEQIFLDTRKSAMKNKEGEVFGIVGVSRDVTVLKNTERELKEKQQYLKSVFESLSDLIFIIDKNGIFISYYNPNKDETLYRQPEEFLGEHYAKILPPEVAEKAKKTIELVYLTQKPHQYDYELELNGKIEWFNAKLSVYKDINGSYNGVTAVIRNVTKRKLAENELKKSNEKILESNKKIQQATERYNLLANNINDFIWMIDFNLNVTYASPSSVKFTGYTFEELKKVSFNSIHTKKSNELIKNVIKQAISDYKKPNYKPRKSILEVEYLHKNGTVIIAEVIGQLIFNRENKLVGIGGISRDITRRKETEKELQRYKNHLEELVKQRTQELEQSKDKFKNIFNTSKDAIFITNFKGDYLEVNTVSCERTGLSVEELKQSNLINFHDSKEIKEYFEKIKNKENAIFTGNYTNKRGKLIHIEMYGKLIDYDNQLAVIHVSRDISERKELQKEILKSVINTEEKERERFAKDLHDGLGAQLSAIRMYLKLLERAKLKPEEIENTIKETVGLIDMAAKSAKEIAVNMRPHELTHFGLAKTVLSFCKKINRIGRIQIHADVSNLKAKLDEQKELFIFRIVSELINNTLKYAEAKNIKIEMSSDKTDVCIDYSDDGKGFDIKRVIEKKEKGGLGIGNIINRTETMGGEVEINSEKGKGMTAKIRIKQ